jgi:hypothetical protein
MDSPWRSKWYDYSQARDLMLDPTDLIDRYLDETAAP